MKTYITFGQIHTHRINGTTLDCDCIGVLSHGDDESGHEIAMEMFDAKFHHAYTEEQWNKMDSPLEYFPRGLVDIN